MDAPREKVGQYFLQRKLGEGGMGAVFLGEHEFTGRLAAIKMISGGHFENEDSIRRLKDEARALGKISHPNIVNVLDFFPEGGAFYLVLEYVNGASLDKIFQVSQVNLFQAVDTAIKAGQGIAAAHAHGILHRDIKPQNVMISESGEVKLMDFGLAKFADATSKTRTGVIMGTPRYMSPEQCRGGALDERSDLYSFGVLLYRLVCGREPFIEGDAFTIAAKHVYERPQAPEEFNPAIPPELSRIILKSLEKDPAARHPSMDLMLRELDRLRSALKAQTDEAPAPLTATLALTHIHAAMAAGAGGATPGPRTPSGLRFTGVRQVDSGARPPPSPGLPTELAPRRRNLLLRGIRGLGIVFGKVIGSPGRRAFRLALICGIAAATLLAGAKLWRWLEANQPPPVLDWVAIPAGSFQMGCVPGDQDCWFDESPRHKVTLGAFEMMADEVTAAQYRRFARATGAAPPDDPMQDTDPATLTRWNDAKQFCEWVGGRLPSEAEWEYAARGGANDSIYPWGNTASHEQANFEGVEGRDRWEQAAPVGSFPPNGFGLYDMVSNACEWTADWHADDYYQTSPADNPRGPPTGTRRVLRGCGWGYNKESTRVSYRIKDSPDFPNINWGFRCARDANPGARAANDARAIPPAASTGTAPEALAAGPEAEAASWAQIPAGSFQMGCVPGDATCQANENPRHPVTLSRGFHLMKREVTVADYMKCAAAGQCGAIPTIVDAPGLAAEQRENFSSACNGNKADRQDHPVNCIDWAAAAAYCKWQAARLPTEAEWEYAARGGQDGMIYPWGDSASHDDENYGSDKCCSGQTGGKDQWDNTAPAGSFPANGFGIFDLGGNVNEWTADWYGEKDYKRGAVTDPAGPASGEYRVVRGGNWGTGSATLRASYRAAGAPDSRINGTGFRCARD